MQQMAVSEIVKNYPPIYPEGGNWAATVEYLYYHEAAFMAELSESVAKYGFRDPIYLAEYDERGFFVGDGTHRVALAIKEGYEMVPVINELAPWPDHVNFSIELRFDLKNDAKFSEEEDDLFIETFRSFKVDEDVWMTSSGMSGAYNSWGVLLDTFDTEIASKAEVRAKELFAEVFPNYEAHIEAVVDFFEDELRND